LQEQKCALQHSLSELQDEFSQQKKVHIDASCYFDKTLAEKDAINNRLLQAEERRAISAEREAAEGVKLVKGLREKIVELGAQIEDVRKQAAESVMPSEEHIEAVDTLRAKIAELEDENGKLRQRAQGLKKRYQEGDLVSVQYHTPHINNKVTHARTRGRKISLTHLSRCLSRFMSKTL
jgi:chromosome segregation ATPase